MRDNTNGGNSYSSLILIWKEKTCILEWNLLFYFCYFYANPILL